ncbi:MAG TPA: hypothetical protein VMW47_11200 [Verrucomicrobiae bacterium]|nr:hypothetical protein [Verrucomicrobiae bacterium]
MGWALALVGVLALAFFWQSGRLAALGKAISGQLSLTTGTG